MKITTIVFLLISSLILFGCGKEEEKATPPQTTAPEEKPMDKPAVVEQTEQVVQQAQEKVAEVTEQAKEKVEQVKVQAQEKVAKVTEQAQEKVTQAQDQVKSLIPGGLSGLSSDTGQKIYDQSCKSCHKSGLLGAPETGDKAAWAPLISGGTEPLVQSVIQGKGKMPKKGGNSSLSNDEIKAAVDYMIEQSK